MKLLDEGDQVRKESVYRNAVEEIVLVLYTN